MRRKGDSFSKKKIVSHNDIKKFDIVFKEGEKDNHFFCQTELIATEYTLEIFAVK
ncbi:MAG: hypothetical protein ABIK84_01145 [candidate division WOR-3 bacterium]